MANAADRPRQVPLSSEQQRKAKEELEQKLRLIRLQQVREQSDKQAEDARRHYQGKLNSARQQALIASQREFQARKTQDVSILNSRLQSVLVDIGNAQRRASASATLKILAADQERLVRREQSLARRQRTAQASAMAHQATQDNGRARSTHTGRQRALTRQQAAADERAAAHMQGVQRVEQLQAQAVRDKQAAQQLVTMAQRGGRSISGLRATKQTGICPEDFRTTHLHATTIQHGYMPGWQMGIAVTGGAGEVTTTRPIHNITEEAAMAAEEHRRARSKKDTHLQELASATQERGRAALEERSNRRVAEDAQAELDRLNTIDRRRRQGRGATLTNLAAMRRASISRERTGHPAAASTRKAGPRRLVEAGDAGPPLDTQDAQPPLAASRPEVLAARQSLEAVSQRLSHQYQPQGRPEEARGPKVVSTGTGSPASAQEALPTPPPPSRPQLQPPHPPQPSTPAPAPPTALAAPTAAQPPAHSTRSPQQGQRAAASVASAAIGNTTSVRLPLPVDPHLPKTSKERVQARAPQEPRQEQAHPPNTSAHRARADAAAIPETPPHGMVHASAMAAAVPAPGQQASRTDAVSSLQETDSTGCAAQAQAEVATPRSSASPQATPHHTSSGALLGQTLASRLSCPPAMEWGTTAAGQSPNTSPGEHAEAPTQASRASSIKEAMDSALGSALGPPPLLQTTSAAASPQRRSSSSSSSSHVPMGATTMLEHPSPSSSWAETPLADHLKGMPSPEPKPSALFPTSHSTSPMAHPTVNSQPVWTTGPGNWLKDVPSAQSREGSLGSPMSLDSWDKADLQGQGWDPAASGMAPFSSPQSSVGQRAWPPGPQQPASGALPHWSAQHVGSFTDEQAGPDMLTSSFQSGHFESELDAHLATLQAMEASLRSKALPFDSKVDLLMIQQQELKQTRRHNRQITGAGQWDAAGGVQLGNSTAAAPQQAVSPVRTQQGHVQESRASGHHSVPPTQQPGPLRSVDMFLQELRRLEEHNAGRDPGSLLARSSMLLTKSIEFGVQDSRDPHPTRSHAQDKHGTHALAEPARANVSLPWWEVDPEPPERAVLIPEACSASESFGHLDSWLHSSLPTTYRQAPSEDPAGCQPASARWHTAISQPPADMEAGVLLEEMTMALGQGQTAWPFETTTVQAVAPNRPSSTSSHGVDLVLASSFSSFSRSPAESPDHELRLQTGSGRAWPTEEPTAWRSEAEDSLFQNLSRSVEGASPSHGVSSASFALTTSHLAGDSPGLPVALPDAGLLSSSERGDHSLDRIVLEWASLSSDSISLLPGGRQTAESASPGHAGQHHMYESDLAGSWSPAPSSLGSVRGKAWQQAGAKPTSVLIHTGPTCLEQQWPLAEPGGAHGLARSQPLYGASGQLQEASERSHDSGSDRDPWNQDDPWGGLDSSMQDRLVAPPSRQAYSTHPLGGHARESAPAEGDMSFSWDVDLAEGSASTMSNTCRAHNLPSVESAGRSGCRSRSG